MADRLENRDVIHPGPASAVHLEEPRAVLEPGGYWQESQEGLRRSSAEPYAAAAVAYLANLGQVQQPSDRSEASSYCFQPSELSPVDFDQPDQLSLAAVQGSGPNQPGLLDRSDADSAFAAAQPLVKLESPSRSVAWQFAALRQAWEVVDQQLRLERARSNEGPDHQGHWLEVEGFEKVERFVAVTAAAVLVAAAAAAVPDLAAAVVVAAAAVAAGPEPELELVAEPVAVAAAASGLDAVSAVEPTADFAVRPCACCAAFPVPLPSARIACCSILAESGPRLHVAARSHYGFHGHLQLAAHR